MHAAGHVASSSPLGSAIVYLLIVVLLGAALIGMWKYAVREFLFARKTRLHNQVGSIVKDALQPVNDRLDDLAAAQIGTAKGTEAAAEAATEAARATVELQEAFGRLESQFADHLHANTCIQANCSARIPWQPGRQLLPPRTSHNVTPINRPRPRP